MAVVADRVIVELEAKLGKYEANVLRAEQKFDKAMGKIGASAVSAERQIKASTGAISSSLTSMAGAFAAAFSAQKVAQLADSYTKFTNQLRVAGLEGENLIKTQEDLFGIAQRYGTQLEGVGTLYGRLSGNTKELGLSNSQLLQFVEGTAAALKVSGRSAGEATGALLQLSQALGGSKIQAEEYNSLIDGARPLLQAVADGSDKFRGSVAKLTSAVKDGKVGVQEFVDAGLRGIPALIQKSEQANLTIGASFTVLNNALGKYIGETDASLSATARVSQAIKSLADNLDTVIPALTAIATLIGVKYVASVGLATGATIAKSIADVRAAETTAALAVMQARLNPLLLGTAANAAAAAASISSLSVASGVASRGLGSLLALVGGPVGAAMLAFGAAIYYVHEQTLGLKNATGAHAKAQTEAAKVADSASKILDKLASAHGRARDEALAEARAEAENTKQKIASAKASLKLAAAELLRARARTDSLRESDNQAAVLSGGELAPGLGASFSVGVPNERQAEANLVARHDNLKSLEASLKKFEASIAAGETPISPIEDDKKKKKRSGKSAEDIAIEQERDLSRLHLEELNARLDITTNLEDRANLQRQILDEERAQRVADINANKDLSDKQKAAQLAAIDRLYGARSTGPNDITVSAPGLYQQGQRKDIEKERNKLAIDAIESERQTLEAEAGIIETRVARRDAELRILALLEEEEKSRLEAQIAAGEIADAATERARLERRQAARQTDTSRQYESPLQGYARRLNKTPDQITDQVQGYVIDELDAVQQGIANALSDAIGTKDPLINGLINLLIQQVIMKPLAEALAGIGGGGGGIGGIAIGLISSVFGGLFADGGTPPMGKVSVVGERGPELFIPKQAGVIVPNHALKGGGNTTVVQQTFVLDNRGGITTPELIDYINQTARTEALGAGRAAYSQSMKDAPAAISSRNRYGA